MSKCKLTVADVTKLELACKLADVNVIEKISYGEITQVVLQFKQPAQLVEVGQYLQRQITPPVEKKQPETVGELAAETAAKKTGKK
jgi:RecJ-like exonuclease